MVDAVNGVNSGKIDITKWKKLTPQEILREQGKGEEEIPAEIVAWAQQMAALAKAPDNVTYEQLDGDVGIDALDKLGIEEEPPVAPEDDNEGVRPEEPDAVRDPAKIEAENEINENVFVSDSDFNITDTEPEEEENEDNEEFTLADTSITTDPNEIRKRKERKGIQT